MSVSHQQIHDQRASEWQIEQLDLDAYLSRVGYQGARQPHEQTLAALHRAHVAAVPFENLDIME